MNKILPALLGASLLLVGAGCASTAPVAPPTPSGVVGAPAPQPSPAPVTAPVPKTVTLSETDNGTTVQVAEGSMIDLVLHSTYWTIQAPDAKTVKPLMAEATVTPDLKGGVPGSGAGTVEMKYTVSGKGIAGIAATRTSCGEAMRCTGDQGSFHVTIDSTGTAPSAR